MSLLACLFLFFLGCILWNSELSFHYAAQGLNLWFERMIPVLFPFMILSGIMIRMKYTEKIASLIRPVLRVYRIRKNVCYAIFMGFLCGFPMGAKVVAELYTENCLTKQEAEFLLSFCNNIGPVYFISFVLPLLGRKQVLPYLFGMYGIPLLYGFVLRYTCFRDLNGLCDTAPVADRKCLKHIKSKMSVSKLLLPILQAADDSIHASIQSILALGGYMILFNVLNLIPHLCCREKHVLFAPLLEITGGLISLGDKVPLYSLLALSFGGLSCLAQSYHCLRGTDLSISRYILHKINITLLNGFYYLGWFWLFPLSFPK